MQRGQRFHPIIPFCCTLSDPESPSPAIPFLYAIYSHQPTDDEYPLYSPCTRPLSRSPADTRLAHTQLCAIFKRAKAPFALALSTTVELRALLQQIALALPLCLPTACTATPAPRPSQPAPAEPAASSRSSRAIGLFPVGAYHAASVITEHRLFALPTVIGARCFVAASTGRVRGRLAGRVHFPQPQWWDGPSRATGTKGRLETEGAGPLVHTSYRTPPRHSPGSRIRIDREIRQPTCFGHRQG